MCLNIKKPEVGEIIYCRALFPKELFLPDSDTLGEIREDPFRDGLYSLALTRNDPLVNSFENHLKLANLGNIDRRPLLNLWSVLEYLTKYNANSGK